jgi:hypothetical protein
MAKDAFDRWWERAEKPADGMLTIPAHIHHAVMQLPPDTRRHQAIVNEAVRLADLTRRGQCSTDQASLPWPDESPVRSSEQTKRTNDHRELSYLQWYGAHAASAIH